MAWGRVGEGHSLVISLEMLSLIFMGQWRDLTFLQGKWPALGDFELKSAI